MERTKTIEAAWENKEHLQDEAVQAAIVSVINDLDQGKLRVAEPSRDAWKVNDWVQKAVVLYFLIRPMEVSEAGPLTFYDKIKLKTNYKQLGVRVVPPAVARYGSFLNKGVILLASYINIGAYIDEGTMIDIWTIVGSCAQIGKNIHVSAGVTIGGVLEPIQATPVIIEDQAFIGSKCVIVEGVRVGKEAVIGANVTLTASTRIIDVTNEGNPQTYRGYIPERSVVIPGSFPKQFPAGQYHVPCALIIGKRKESTDLKTSLNETLRAYGVNA
ncbi:MAG: 2,3,4,5-tetrahydropyridine-2,6-dicarboxylate N-succinyltransferase [Cytophagales bacterium]|nr:2,3,4,5-tetrahydropyridine-2,6-dicarboxylate N-succinyltransferase [Cytophagales bacterium]